MSDESLEARLVTEKPGNGAAQGGPDPAASERLRPGSGALSDRRLQLLYDITMQPETELARRLEYGLERTRVFLGLEVGVVGQIEAGDYTVRHVAPAGALDPGRTVPLGETFCSLTLAADELVAIEHVQQTSHREHPCYQLLGTECYIGIPIVVSGRRYGTVSFSSNRPRALPFAEADRQTVALLGRWIGTTLEQAEAAARLAASETQFQRIAANVTGMIYQFRLGGRHGPEFPFVSAGSRAIFGLEPEAIVADAGQLLGLIHPDDKQSFYHSLNESALELGRWAWEGRAIRPDGEVRWVSTQSRPERRSDGRVLWYGVLLDVTEQKATEERFRQLFEASIDGLLLLEDERIVDCNRAALAMLGLSDRASLLNRSLDNLSPERQPDGQESTSRIGELLARAAEEGPQRFRWQYRRDNGQLFSVEVALNPVPVADRPALLVVWRDDADRRQAEQALARRASQLATAAEVATLAATSQNPAELLQVVADLTRERFGLYHAHVYLLNDAGTVLELAAGAGATGRQMVSEGHQIPVDRERSLVARAARTRRGVIVNNVAGDTGFLPNPLLPRTHSELAVPIIAGESLLGVLDVQAEQVNAFSDEDVNIHTVLAGQIGVALQNARSFAQSESARRELAELTRRLTLEGWQAHMARRPAGGLRYGYDQNELKPVDGDGVPDEAAGSLVGPLQVQGATVGRLTLVDPVAAPEDAATVVAAVAAQLSAHLENLRLNEQTQAALAATEAQARRLARLNAIGAALGRAQTAQEVIAVARQHVGPVFNSPRVTLTLLIPDGVGQRLAVYDLDQSMAAETAPATDMGLEGTALAEVVQERRLFNFPDIAESPFQDNQALARIGIRSRLVAPLVAPSGVLGTLNVGSPTPSAYDAADENLMQQLASLLAATFENRQLAAETRARAEQLERLSRAEGALSLANTETDILEALAGALSGPQNLWLQYFSLDDQGDPLLLTTVARWENGSVTLDFPAEPGIEVRSLPGAEVWLAARNQPFIVTDVTAESRLPELARLALGRLGAGALIVLPLFTAGRWQGRVLLTWDQPVSLSEGDRFMLARLLEPVAAVVASRRALLAQQAALAETERLYSFSARLNAATSLDEILQAVAAAGVAANLGSASLSTLEVDDTGRPAFATLAALWVPPGASMPAGAGLGVRFDLAELPSARIWIDDPQGIVLVEDSEADRRLDKTTRELFAHLGIASNAIMPLNQRGKWIGLLNLTWPEARRFTAAEQRLFESLQAQTTVAVDNLILFEQAQQRAAQLEKLAQLEVALSLADDEEGILETLLATLAADDLHSASLAYLDELDGDLVITTINRWQAGALLDRPEPPGAVQLATDETGVDLWRAQANRLVIVGDVETESRAAGALRRRAQTEGWRATVLLPLRSGGRWQALVSFNWRRPRSMTADELFLMERIMEPLAATVATRRASLAQQAARQEIELLYRAGRSINQAVDLTAILAAVVASVPEAGIGRAAIWSLERDETGVIDRAALLASWHHDRSQPPALSGSSDALQTLSSVDDIQATEPRFVTDLHSRMRDDAATRPVAGAFWQELRSMAWLPLLAGSRPVGLMVLGSARTHEFSDSEIRTLTSLAPQAAVAIQNRTLLQATQARARQERILREITAQVRGAASVDTIMRTAAREIGRALGRQTFVYVEDQAVTSGSRPEDDPE